MILTIAISILTNLIRFFFFFKSKKIEGIEPMTYVREYITR